MRAEELTPRQALGARELLDVYARLADRGAHALGELLVGGAPGAWDRLPADDAVDRAGFYQWFYHSHGPEDGRGDAEHGHFHLFARRVLWEQIAEGAMEQDFASFAGSHLDAETVHLLGISIDPKGVPIGFFTVASHVTADAMIGARATLEALRRMELNTGFPDIDRIIESVVALCLPEVETLLTDRDNVLRAAHARGFEPPEVLSELALDLDSKIVGASRTIP